MSERWEMVITLNGCDVSDSPGLDPEEIVWTAVVDYDYDDPEEREKYRWWLGVADEPLGALVDLLRQLKMIKRVKKKKKKKHD